MVVRYHQQINFTFTIVFLMTKNSIWFGMFRNFAYTFKSIFTTKNLKKVTEKTTVHSVLITFWPSTIANEKSSPSQQQHAPSLHLDAAAADGATGAYFNKHNLTPKFNNCARHARSQTTIHHGSPLEYELATCHNITQCTACTITETHHGTRLRYTGWCQCSSCKQVSTFSCSTYAVFLLVLFSSVCS